jgi:predicted nucleic acid-binding protein
MKTNLYLDTSIPSAYFDISKPARQIITQKWFELDSEHYNLFVSVITIEEIEQLKNPIKKQSIKELLLNRKANIMELSDKAKNLADEYIKRGAIPKSEPADALHIAIATVNSNEALASWNFKHIVSLSPIRKMHEINRKLHYPILEIGSLEIFGGATYGNL